MRRRVILHKYDQSKYIIVLVFCLISMSFYVGYSILTQNITATGTSIVDAGSWDIRFIEASVDSSTSSSISSISPVIDTTNGNMSISVNGLLLDVGDVYKYNATIKNNGTVNARIVGINLPTIPDYVEYTITYGNSSVTNTGTSAAFISSINSNSQQFLNINATISFSIELKYKDNVTTSTYPTDDILNNVVVVLNYEQA